MKFSDIRLVVTDLDGTFLAADQTMQPENAAMVRRLRQAGIGFSIASGRAYEMYEVFAQQLQIDLPVIACDGGEIRAPQDGRVLASFAMNPDETVKILHFAVQEKMDYVIYAGQEVYFAPQSTRVARFRRYNQLAKEAGCRLIEIRSYDGDAKRMAERGVVKILLLESGGGDVAKMQRFLQGFREVHACSPESNALDILSNATSKGLALTWLIKKLGIEARQVCVLGDAMNDRSMFEAAGYSIAMGGAFPALKSLATAVTDTCEHAGFAKAIQRYIL